MSTVRTERIEVYKLPGDRKETSDRWHNLANTVQQITNCIWETWLVWHVQNRSADAQREFLDRFAEWKKEKQGDKPKCEIVAIPKVLDKLIYDTLAKEFPNINTTVRELVRNEVCSDLKTHKAANGSLPGWVAILLRNQSIPSSTRSQPIPFSKKCAKIVPPAEKSERYIVELRADRIDKPGSKTAGSTLDRVELMTHRRGGQRATLILDRITAGEYDFCGSSLKWDKQNRKWFALICYRIPETDKKPLDVGKAAILHSGRSYPWKLKMSPRYEWLGGRGHAVSATRTRLLTSRWSMQENYRHAGSSTKGHGRERALKSIVQLQQGWKNFCKTYNHNVTSMAVKLCLERGIGRLIYFQPSGSIAERKFLSTAGKVPGKRDGSSWEWFQVASMLAYKCQEAGILLDVRKSGEKHGAAKKTKPSRKVRPVLAAS